MQAQWNSREDGIGSRFSSATRTVPAGKNARILYAEDDKVLREITAKMLDHAGYKVLFVENGLLAWEALQVREFDLLITDNDMPNLTGIELVTRLRLQKVPLPVILASGSAGFFSGEEYKWLQFNACLQKPFPPDRLISAVENVINSAG